MQNGLIFAKKQGEREDIHYLRGENPSERRLKGKQQCQSASGTCDTTKKNKGSDSFRKPPET